MVNRWTDRDNNYLKRVYGEISTSIIAIDLHRSIFSIHKQAGKLELSTNPGVMPKPPSERFWDKVQTGKGCWGWLGAKNTAGYGIISIGTSKRSKSVMAHRISYEIHFGEIPDGVFVCHTCDNPECVYPDHLFLGTHSENMADMVSKKRHTYGGRNGRAKLCELDVWVIRELKHLKNKTVAEFFGVSAATISQINSRQSWKHV